MLLIRCRTHFQTSILWRLLVIQHVSQYWRQVHMRRVYVGNQECFLQESNGHEARLHHQMLLAWRANGILWLVKMAWPLYPTTVPSNSRRYIAKQPGIRTLRIAKQQEGLYFEYMIARTLIYLRSEIWEICILYIYVIYYVQIYIYIYYIIDVSIWDLNWSTSAVLSLCLTILLVAVRDLDVHLGKGLSA